MVEPQEGAKPSMQTDVYVLATQTEIYIGAVCYDSSPDKIASYTMMRDAFMEDEDHIKFVFDTFMDGRTGYVFAVNPNGARYDALIANEGEGENPQWDGIWEAKAKINKNGWSVEIKIPVKTLRFQQGLSSWGFNVERRIQRFQETDRWASPIRNFKVTHVSRAGILTGLPDFKQGSGITIRPYTLGGFVNENFGTHHSYQKRIGIDVIKNFGGNLSGLVSVNTDFAETEVDARQINLTRFPLFFPEKRTFFLEGADVFDFGLGLGGHMVDLIPFFTRRIGLVRGHIVPLDLAIKLTGKVGSFNIGVLDALTGEVKGVAPRSNMFAMRVYKNILEESKTGLIFTYGDPTGRKRSWMAGVDFTYKTSRFYGDKNFLIGVWGLVNDRIDLKGDKTAFGFKIDYPNDLLDAFITFKHIGDGFDPSLGFVRWNGINKLNFGFSFNPRPSWKLVRQMFHEFYVNYVTDLKGEPFQWRIFMAPVNWQLESGDRFEINYVPNWERIPEEFEIDQAKVEPGKYRWTRYRIEVESAEKRKWKAKFTWWFGTFYNGKLDQYESELEIRPSSKFNISLEYELNRGKLPTGKINIKLLRSRLSLYLSPDFQIISFIQYDNLSKSLGMNTRLRWTYRSIFDVFLVYNRNWIDTGSHLATEFNQVLLKVQYAWRP